MQPSAGVGLTIDEVETRAGKVENFDAVVELYWPRVFRFALAWLRDRDGAATLAQDCFVKAYKSLPSFRGECSLQTWLMQIAVNLIHDHVRNRRLQFWKRTRDLGVPVDAIGQWLPNGEASPESRALQREQLAAVWDAAATLSEKQRTVFLLRFVEDMDLLEIAAAMGMKEGTVKIHLFRALQSVRAKIGSLK